ncbi:MAG: hypothetical protein ACOX68_06430 [Candidatus Limivicinus sp.]|jgi:hypothetical protein
MKSGLCRSKNIRWDLFIALALILCVFALNYFSLTSYCMWGDDWAAYISEGIAIAEGRLDEQAALNAVMHPSPMPKEALSKPIYYVWGYPLLMALVYSIVGFDRVGFSSIIYYKLPTVISLALLAGVFYLFLRRRLGRKLSVFLSLTFCLNSSFHSFIDTLYSDIVFLFFAVLTLYISELFLSANKPKSRLIWGIVLGILMWYSYEVRLNGFSILLVIALAHILSIVKSEPKPKGTGIFINLLPYILFFVLKFSSEAILAPATSNSSDLKNVNLGIFIGNFSYYLILIKDFFGNIWDSLFYGMAVLGVNYSNFAVMFYIKNILTYFTLFLCVVGIVSDGIKRNLHYSIFILATLTVSSMLIYNQGLRYIFPVLPLLVMYAGYGFMFLLRHIPLKLRSFKGSRLIAVLITAAMCLLAAAPTAEECEFLRRGYNIDGGISSVEEFFKDDAFSPAAKEAYTYIRNETAPDSVIGFFKPRALYLSTERLSVFPIMNGHSLDETDYFLNCHHIDGFEMPEYVEVGENFVPVFRNEQFVIYKNTGR